MAGVCSYAASKGAISSLTRQMAVEYATQGIRAHHTAAPVAVVSATLH